MHPAHIGHLIDRNAHKYPTKTAIVGETQRLDYGTLKKRVDKLAHGLNALGISKGERVATLLTNRPELLITYYALFRLGAILVPLNIRLVDPEWVYILKDCGAGVLICEDLFAERVKNLLKDCPGINQVIGVGEPPESFGFLSWNELQNHPREDPPQGSLDIEDPLYILYTSGTTGKPKGAVLTNLNLVWNCLNAQLSAGVYHNDVVYYGLPLFHAAAMGGYFACAMAGGTVVLRAKFEPLEFLDLAQEEGITRVPAVPAMLLALLDIPDIGRWDLSSIRSFNTGTTPIPQSLKQRLKARFPWVEVWETYGLTEATAYCTTLPGKDSLRKESCAGLPHPYVELRVVDARDQDVFPGEVGEILIRGANVMVGYYNRQEETAGTLRGGWLHTGDLGRMDSEGYLYVVDRKKDMIISGGENIYPREVEEVLHSHPGVKEAAVVGIPDEKWGERVKAFVISASEPNPSVDALSEYCAKRLAKYKCPKEFVFVKEFPRTSSGKILKRILRVGTE